MKIAIYVFLFSLCIISEPVKAKILTAEGRGVSEAIAKAILRCGKLLIRLFKIFKCLLSPPLP